MKRRMEFAALRGSLPRRLGVVSIELIDYVEIPHKVELKAWVS
jgi:hypothetical protein